MSYDLGLQGDYASLYQWLDAHGAKECGDSMAVVNVDYADSLKDDLKEELARSVEIDKKTRIYIVYRDETTGKNKGVFLFGGRREPPWTGYSSSEAEVVDEEVS
ncbi:MAG: hypothetical protein ACK59A_06685 [Cyanobacteriota bacterium]